MDDAIVNALERNRLTLNRERLFAQFQPLADLGYLNHTDINEKMSESLKRTAIIEFRKDYSFVHLLKYRYNFEDPDAYYQYAFMLNPAEEDLLHKMVSINGEFVLPYGPELGRVSLYSRIVHFRLRLFGLWQASEHCAVSNPYTQKSVQALVSLARLCGMPEKNLMEIVLCCGNLNALLDHFFVYTEKNISKKVAYVPKQGVVLDDKASELVLSQSNRFLSRVYQLFLWVKGAYTGRIDGDLGQMTIGSLKELLRLVNEASHEKKLVLANFFGGDRELPYYMWNVGDLMKLKQESESKKPVNSFSLVDNLVNDDFPLEDITASLMNVLGSDSKKNRQSYFGEDCTKLFQEPVIKELYDNIRKRNFLAKGSRKRFFSRIFRKSGVLRSFIRGLLQTIRNGLSVFLHGLRFLMGRRTIFTSNPQGHSVVSRFDCDFDVILLADAQLDPHSLKQHGQKCIYMSNSLKQSLSLCGSVIKTVYLLSTPVGWAQLSLIIGRKVTQIHL